MPNIPTSENLLTALLKRGLTFSLTCLAWGLISPGCSRNPGADNQKDVAAESPPAAQVEREQDASVVQADHPEEFALATAEAHAATSVLVVTGTVSPDVARTVPVISLASGRVVDIRARLGDTVTKGQLLVRVQSADVSGAFSDFRKAVSGETLARSQADRARELYDHGATSLNDLQIAQDAANKSKVDVETTAEHLRLLGGDIHHPSGVVDVVAPISGVITEQNVTQAAGVKTLDNSPNLFTIADLSRVWIICDVYENDLARVHLGETADITLNAYPGRVITGHISDIGAVLDPSLRTAKVRVEVSNPGMMRVGMFVTAAFHGRLKETHAAVPATAILHLHDRDWVYVPAGNKKFRRIEVTGGDMLPNHRQEVLTGLQAGQRVVANALELQNTVEQ